MVQGLFALFVALVKEGFRVSCCGMVTQFARLQLFFVLDIDHSSDGHTDGTHCNQGSNTYSNLQKKIIVLLDSDLVLA